jgi:hypothetical protein
MHPAVSLPSIRSTGRPTDRTVMGLKLKKRMLEEQLANIESAMGGAAAGGKSRRSARASRSSQSRKRPERRAEAGKQLYTDALASLGSSEPFFGLNGLSVLTTDKKKLVTTVQKQLQKSPPRRQLDQPVTVHPAVSTEDNLTNRTLHKRNTELLVRQRRRVETAHKKLPPMKGPKAGAFKKHQIPRSLFPTAYKRG